MDAFDALQAKGIDVPFIVIVGFIGEEKAVACIKKGAADCVLKTNLVALPWRRAGPSRTVTSANSLRKPKIRCAKGSGLFVCLPIRSPRLCSSIRELNAAMPTDGANTYRLFRK